MYPIRLKYPGGIFFLFKILAPNWGISIIKLSDQRVSFHRGSKSGLKGQVNIKKCLI